MKLIALIRAYNEEKSIGQVIDKVRKYVDEIIVVDDASTDETYRRAREKGARLFQHAVNQGPGAALATGLKAALSEGADIAVLLDADDQHDPSEIPNLIKPILEGSADTVTGSRFLQFQKMPLFRRIGNHFFNFITFLLFGIWSSDTQSGFRAFNRKAMENLKIKTGGMEVASELMAEIKRCKLRLKEVPIKAIYTSYSMSKGQGFSVGLKTLVKIFIYKLNKK